jgi:hypothetical protein
MRVSDWLLRSSERRRCVAGLVVSAASVEVVVLSGPKSQPDSVCGADHLVLSATPAHDMDGFDPQRTGAWIQTYFKDNDYQVDAIYLAVPDEQVSSHRVELAWQLSEDDLLFQLLAQVQAELPPDADVCIDFNVALPTQQPAAADRLSYEVRAVARSQVLALQQLAQAMGLPLVAVESASEASQRAQHTELLSAVSDASAALALQYSTALGLALGAWQEGRFNFLPHRLRARQAARHAWFARMAASVALGFGMGSLGTWGLSVQTARQAMPLHASQEVMRTLTATHKAYQEAKAKQAKEAELQKWLVGQAAVQAQSLRWSQVLSQDISGFWVADVQQRGVHWVLTGEALTAAHAQGLVSQLAALNIWAKPPQLPQLQQKVQPTRAGLAVWQFRIEADLKDGV